MSRNDPSVLQIVLDELREFRREFKEDRENVDARLTALENDIRGAKLLSRAALAVVIGIGSFVTWLVSLAGTVKGWWPGASH